MSGLGCYSITIQPLLRWCPFLTKASPAWRPINSKIEMLRATGSWSAGEKASKHQTQKIHHRTWDCDSFTFNDKWDLNSVLFSLRHYNIWKVQRVFKNGNLNLKQDYGVHDVHDVHEAYDSLLTCHSTEKSKPNVKGLRFCICKLHMQVNRQMRLEAISSKGM